MTASGGEVRFFRVRLKNASFSGKNTYARIIVKLLKKMETCIEKKELGDGFKMKGEWIFVIEDTETGFSRRTHAFNIIPTVAKTAFAAQISGDNTTDIGDNLYIALGSNTTAPAAGDTQLGTEVVRKTATSTTFSGAVGYVSVFFAAGEATGTHREFGLFGNGNASAASGTANTGILFSHVAANITVSSVETLTCQFSITFSS